jgi:hypothetical protein
MYRTILLSLILAATVAGLAAAQSREDKVRTDRKKVEADGFWIYNDLARGFAEARTTGKPMLVILRCIPCVECVKLDDDLVNQDRRLRPLLEKFVRVRVVSTNGLDLSLFQFDYDQSFAAFVMNADRTIYGRYGTRSHRTSWADDVSIEGLAKTLEGALQLHRDYSKIRKALAAKTGPAPEFASPEKYPLLRERYKPTLDYAGKVVPSCIHCHQIGDAQRQVYRDRGAAIPEKLLFAYPHPKILGLILDPKERATVLRVEPDSAAKEAGFEKGDVILELASQPLLSIADVQWVLHHASPRQESLTARVQRGDRQVTLILPLAKGWRQRDNLSWRVAAWGLRRMATGGMLLEDLPEGERKKAGLSDKVMALRVRYVGGGGGPHGAAMRAGFRQGDILVSFDGKDDLLRETDVLVDGVSKHKPGDQLTAAVLRGRKKIELKLPIQK